VTSSRAGGVLAPITTPFDSSGELALGHARETVARLLAEGLDGVLVAGSTGEAPLLEGEEQRRLVAAVREIVPTGKWLLVGTGAESTRGAIALSQVAAAEGADAVLVRPPGYFGALHSPASLSDHFHAVADASPVPVLLYNMPKYTHLPIAVEVLQRLAGHARIIGVKDSSGDATNLAAYRAAVPHWSVFVGSGSLLYAALELGCEGGVLAIACFAPRASAELLAAFRAGDRARARAIQDRLVTLDKEIVGRHGPAGVKAAMDAVGMYGGPVRPPLAPLAPDERRRVASLVAA
jgi:4-hydroxy-2-oxoglutarate aldolase